MKCPSCFGEGGWTEAVLYRGMGGGPYEECRFCKGEKQVSIRKWLYWVCFIDGPFGFVIWWCDAMTQKKTF